MKRPLGLIVVGYLQLLTGKAKSESRTAEVSCISRQLKRLAKDLNCPVMALSQLNRSLEGNTDKRPGMATCASLARSSRTPS